MKKIINNKIMMFIIILLFFKPICLQYFSNLSLIENLFVYGKILVAILIVFDTLLESYPKVKVNPYLIMIFLFEFLIFLVTIMREGAIFRSFIDFITIFVLCLAIIKFIKNDKEKFLLVMKNTLLLLVSLQLCSEIIWPNGMPADLYLKNHSNPLFFATLDNGTTGLTCITVSLIYLNKTFAPHKFIRLNFEIIICILTAILSGSTTAILCTLVLVFLMLLSNAKFMKVFDKWGLWIGIYALLSYLIIFNNNFISDIFYNITGKAGFTGRTQLWNIAIDMIKNSFILGYGRTINGYLEIWGGFFSSHNLTLELLLQGGIISLFLWSATLIVSLKNTKKIINYKIRRIFIATIFVILISLLMESNVHSEYLFSIMTITWCFANINLLKGNYRKDA